MSYRNFIFFYVLAITLVIPAKAQEPTSQRPNVIIIFADDMGYGDVSGLNPEARTYTPNLDRLTQKAMLFSNAHASASVCTPSRYGILTGRYAWRSEKAADVCNGFTPVVIEPGRLTVANIFQEAGYATACIGKWHLGIGWQPKEGAEEVSFDPQTRYSTVDYSKPILNGPNNFGFDYSFVLPASLDMPPYVFIRNHQVVDPEVILTSEVYPKKLADTEYFWDKKHSKEDDIYWDKGVWWRQGEISKSFRIEDCLTNIQKDGVAYIRKHVADHSDQPFFMYMPLSAPHTPWMPRDQFKGKSAVGTYGDFMLNVDHVVGEIMATLNELDIDDNTMIIFSSDNGAYWPQSEIDLYQHDSNWGTRGQKGDIWDGGHRMPLIIRWPAVIDKRVYNDQLVSLTDLFATFSHIHGQPTPKGSGEDSFSMLPALQGDTDYQIRPSMIHQSSAGMFSFRKGDWKVIEGLGSGGFTSPSHIDSESGGPMGQLYQITTDSLEQDNLYLDHDAINQDLLKEMHQQIDQGSSR
ncbi:MAG: arylsulfatase [Cyclobacteriaceae bacterium]